MAFATPTNSRATFDAVLADAARASMGRHIVSVGFELEGGMNNHEAFKLRRYVQDNGLDHYYSVKFEPQLQVAGKQNSNMEVQFHNEELQELLGLLKFAYENCGFATNSSCGFHIHVRFKDMAGAIRVFSSERVIQDFMIRYAREFRDERYTRRLGSIYCSQDPTLYEPREIGRAVYNKYSPINVGAYIEHQTIEFRIMPNQLSADEAKRSLLWLIRTAEELYDAYHKNVPDPIMSKGYARRALEAACRGDCPDIVEGRT